MTANATSPADRAIVPVSATAPIATLPDRPFRPRLTRSALDRVLGGVGGGIGWHLGVNGWWIRLGALALIAVQPAIGVLIYLLLWLIIPAPSLADQPGADRPRHARPEATLLLGAALVIIGALVLASNFSFLHTPGGDLLPPVLLAILGLVLLTRQIQRVRG